MDEAVVQKRIEQLNASPNMVAFYRAAYADGLEAAAKIANEERVDYDTTRDESDRAYNLACADIEAAIRQHAKEIGHE